MKEKNIFIIASILILMIVLSIVSIDLRSRFEEKAPTEEDIIFSVKNNDFSIYEEDVYNKSEEYTGVKVLEYDNSNIDFAEIYYVSYDYTTDPSYTYTIEIRDESNKSIILDGEEEHRVVGGVVSSVKIKKLSLDSIINMSLFEKIGDKIENSGKTQIDLSKDLEKKVKIDQSENIKEGTLLDIKFKYIDDEFTYHGTTQHAYSEKYVGENSSLVFKIQYGNRLVSIDHVEILGEKNVNNLNLYKAFENMALITRNFGQYGLPDVFGLDLKNNDETETVLVSFDEMIKLCNGQSIEKDGKEYTKDSFEKFAEIGFKKEKELEIGNGIKAIKYINGNDLSYVYYMFAHKGNLYYITVPTEPRISAEIQLFLDSIEIVD